VSGVVAKAEIERKFLVSEADLTNAENVELFSIESVYLDAEKLAKVDPSLAADGDRPREIRVSKRTGTDGVTVYESISKLGGHELTREEAIVTIDEAAFNSAAAKFGKSRIEKKRFKFTYLRNVFELDVFPPSNLIILEIELKDEKQLFALPPYVEIVKDVTGESKYYNASMAEEI